MKPLEIIDQLAINQKTFEQALSGLNEKLVNWKPNEKSWSILEIVCHLCDEEVEDFRTRVRYTLQSPESPPPTIDPQGWVLEREYAKQDFSLVKNTFLKEREKSIDWLISLKNPNWEIYFSHPEFGKRTALFYLSNWLAHDYLHLRQIIRTKYQYLNEHTPLPLEYAGNW